jgi:hypothetical protein
VIIDSEKGKPDRVFYFGFKGLGLYELKDEHWIPVPAIIMEDGKGDNIVTSWPDFKELAFLIECYDIIKTC